MIENIVEVGPETSHHSLADFEVLVYAKVYSPASRAPEKPSLGHRGIVKHIRTERRRSESTRIEELLANVMVGVSRDHGSVITAEITDRVNRLGGNVPRTDEAAAVVEASETVIADPEGREARACFGEHLETSLPASNHSVSPARKRASELPASPNWQVVETEQYEAMLGYPRIFAVIVVRIKRVIRNAAEAGVPLINAIRFLIQIRI